MARDSRKAVLTALVTVVQDYVRARAAAQAILDRAETIINELETGIKAELSRVDHVTIEVKGIVEPPPVTETRGAQACRQAAELLTSVNSAGGRG
jgi:hypothetical protein